MASLNLVEMFEPMNIVEVLPTSDVSKLPDVIEIDDEITKNDLKEKLIIANEKIQKLRKFIEKKICDYEKVINQNNIYIAESIELGRYYSDYDDIKSSEEQNKYLASEIKEYKEFLSSL